MADVKRNFLWNAVKVASGYLFPFLTFPYVTRVLGAEGLGIANFAVSLVDYAVLFSMLGMSYIGCREIAQCGDDRQRRDEVFSCLISLNILLTLLTMVGYIGCVVFLPGLSDHRPLYLAGVSKLAMSVFLAEWFFEGIQDFRYITLRTLAVRSLYTASIFLFVRRASDYDVYFYLTMGQVVVNAAVNWQYAGRYVSFRPRFRNCFKYLKPVCTMGLTAILLSFYGTFNVLYLGFVCDKESVGYYTAAVRLYAILLSVIAAYNGVFVPYLSSLYAQGNMARFREIIEKSLPLVCIVALPVITLGTVYAEEIIRLIAGSGYERAVEPFRIILVQVLLVGIAQIFENQILLAFRRYRDISVITVSTVALAVFIILVYVPRYAEVGSAWAVALPHVAEVVLLYVYARRCIDFRFPFRLLLRLLLICLPIVAMCLTARHLIANYVVAMLVGSLCSGLYYAAMQYYVIRDEFVVGQMKRLTDKITRWNFAD